MESQKLKARESAERTYALLAEAEDCVRMALTGDASPIRRLIALLAFEIGVVTGKLERYENESDSSRSDGKNSDGSPA